jgi:exopolysaccharide biosynthesis polyprenyl glycosylphosphotransferase
MKKSDLLFTAALVPIDYVMIVLAGLAAYFLRFTALAQLRPIIFDLPFWYYFRIILVVAVVCILFLALNGLYRPGRQRFSRELIGIFYGLTVAIMLIVLFVFFQRTLFSSRFIILAGWLIAIVFVALGRIIVHFAHLQTFKNHRGLDRVVVIGKSDLSRELAEHLKNDLGYGYEVKEHLSSVKDFIDKWQNRTSEIKAVIQGDVDLSNEEIHDLVDFCTEHQLVFKYVVDSYGALLTNIKNETLAGIPLLEIRRTALDGWGRIIKRFFDFIISLLLLTILIPLFLVVAIIIKLDSPGSIFVKLNRVGQRNISFGLYKFRSMVKDAHQLKAKLMQYNERQGPLFKMANDPRITKVGRFIRHWSVDELPQLFNVLKGEMSLVGPRPHEPEEVARYDRHQKQLLTIKPGITGLAQISGRSNLPFEEEAKLDIYYMENWALGFDLQIIIKTIPVVLGRKNAN